MSDKEDNRDTKLSDAKTTSDRLLQTNKNKPTKIENVNKRTIEDYLLVLVVLMSIITSFLVNSYLPSAWAPATNVWIRIGIIFILVVIAIVCFIFTSYGRDFKVLVKDAGVELRRVTWPTKSETIHWTWLSIVFMAVFAVLVWALDFVFNKVVKFIIGG